MGWCVRCWWCNTDIAKYVMSVVFVGQTSWLVMQTPFCNVESLGHVVGCVVVEAFGVQGSPSENPEGHGLVLDCEPAVFAVLGEHSI
jgi:hypothetical protein